MSVKLTEFSPAEWRRIFEETHLPAGYLFFDFASGDYGKHFGIQRESDGAVQLVTIPQKWSINAV